MPPSAEFFVKCEEEGDYYNAVRYVECQTRPVRVQPGGCGCDDTACEYSRWRDGYEIRVMRECPTKDDAKCPPLEWNKSNCAHPPECPPCPAEPWVGLAHVRVDAKGMLKINNCDCRRLVASFSKFWWAWNAVGYENTTGIISVEPNRIEKCAESIKVTISGSGFGQHPKVSFDDPVTVQRCKLINDNTIETWITVPKSMSGGSVVVRVVNDYCATAWHPIPVECAPHQDCPPGATQGGRKVPGKAKSTDPGTA